MNAKITAYRTLELVLYVEGETIETIREKAQEEIASTVSADFNIITNEEFEIEADEEQGIAAETITTIAI